MPKKFKFKIPKSKRKKKKDRKTRAIRVDTVEAMFDLYCKEYSSEQIAEELGVSHSTVSKYINAGDPTREIEPLKVRRARIIQAAMSIQDGQLIRRLGNLQAFSSKLLAESGGRLLDRIDASRQLDSPIVYAEGNEISRMILERKALEPEVRDVESVMHMNTQLLDMAARMSGMTSDAPGVQVNVNQAQAQQQRTVAQVTESDPEAMEQVYSYMARTERNAAGHQAVTRMVREASLALEGSDGESEVIADGSPEPPAPDQE